MNEQTQPIDKLLYDLKERAEEFNCLYQIQELLNTPDVTLDQICQGTVKAIPPGWQHPDVCQAQIIIGRQTFQSPDFIERVWLQSAEVIVQDERVGQICVYYTEERPLADQDVHLTPTEYKLLYELARNVNCAMLHEQLLSAVWGPEYLSGYDYLRSYIHLLRRKLEPDPSNPKYILRVPGVGYMLEVDGQT
jgi:DNA-binding winged helix-turn-helix (wHTH) protein